ncbi:ketol-acid reductoisomerase [Pseudomonas sp. GD04058]|uniref:ketol-acid reductoisomerase n=1 Tax=Pseudomonas sp. GD04058 TaxID=2975429 RepID=UPI002446A63C|nr:ketol-acid reductoisomerase [Pseudomonas sp. GD04058]MDG9884262.1 ketol-acid reductoisomerase [Pseudomonas sp. GD04058]
MKLAYMTAFVISSLSPAAYAFDSNEVPRETSLQRAIIEPAMVQQAIELENRISAQADTAAPSGESPVVVLKGSSKVIITAPHATEPFREGKYRFSDGAGTAALAQMLNRTTCATVIYTQYRTPSDPNYYDDNEFKDQLAELIGSQRPALVLDIHGSSDFRPYDVDIGTMNGKSLLGNQALLVDLVEHLRQEGMTNLSNNYFAAEKNQTITRFASSKQVPTLQLEISSTLLRPSEGGVMAHRFAQLLQGLTRYVRGVTNNPTGQCGPTA